MKVKGLTKLALSGVALAAVAATLGTSTYAWYVSNSTAEIAGVSGQTQSATSGNLLLNTLKEEEGVISETGSWGNKFNFTQLTVKNNPALNPTTKDGNNFTPKANTGAATGWHDKSNTPMTTATAYGYVMFGVWSTEKVKANMTFGIANNTSSFTAQTAYTAEGLPSGVTVNSTWTQDFVHALKFEVLIAPLAGAKVNDILATKSTVYNAESAKAADLNSDYASPASTKSGGNAHDYYKAISDEYVTTNVIDGGESATSSAFPGTGVALSLAKNEGAAVKYVVAIRYWLEGTDTDCFDSCAAQTFNLNLKLEAVEA